MMKEIKQFVALAVCLGFASLSFALSTPSGFLDDYDAALLKAKETDKKIYAVFTGSDWCYYCQQLEKKLLSQPEFVEELSKGFVPLFIDLPRDKSLVTEKGAEENKPLARKYKVIGLPTILILDKEGKTLGRADRGKPGETPRETAKRLVDTLTK